MGTAIAIYINEILVRVTASFSLLPAASPALYRVKINSIFTYLLTFKYGEMTLTDEQLWHLMNDDSDNIKYFQGFLPEGH